MSRYRPATLNHGEDLYAYLERELWRISQAVEQQFDNEPVWDDLKVPASSLKTGASAPDFGVWKGNVASYLFDGIATAEYLHFALQLPHGWKEGTTIEPHIHWTTITATSNAAVVWTLEYTWANVDGTFGNTTTITATGSCSTTSIHRLTGFDTDITLSSGLISLMLLGRVGRNPTVTGDTFEHDAVMLELDFHAQLDGHGSVKPFIKL